MDTRVVQVPASLLLDPDRKASTKVLWMALRLHPAASRAELEVHTGLSRHTVLSGRSEATAYSPVPAGPRVKVPVALLADRSAGAQAKVLYGLLQAAGGPVTYASLSVRTKLGRHTLRRAMAELVGAGWVQTTQASRLSPIHFSLSSPEQTRSQADADVVRRRLKRAKFGGEALMQEYLSLLIDSEQYTDNARPGFLVNPQTNERLELDRFYPPNVAFEFHGAQHDRATARFSQEEADAQHLRDLIKAGICLYQGIHLVIIRAEDLSVQRMTKKIGRSMPVRSLAGREPLIDLLEAASLTYRAAAPTA
jgi:hypothetical protein